MTIPVLRALNLASRKERGEKGGGDLTLTLHTYTGKSRCARAIAHHLRLPSAVSSGRTVLASDRTPRRVGPARAGLQPHLTHSCAFFLDAGSDIRVNITSFRNNEQASIGLNNMIYGGNDQWPRCSSMGLN